MARLLVVSPAAASGTPERAPVGALALLPHRQRVVAPGADVATHAERCDAVVIDGSTDLSTARSMCRLLTAAGTAVPILLVVAEGGVPALGPDWGLADFVLASAGPDEVDTRLRLLLASRADDGVTAAAGIVIDESAYHASLHGRSLDLTYTEFELLKYLVQHPGRVFTRETLLTDVWGYDYYGGTRTVDVHVRRLRAKLGVEHEGLIGTVRNVGYRFNPDAGARRERG